MTRESREVELHQKVRTLEVNLLFHGVSYILEPDSDGSKIINELLEYFEDVVTKKGEGNEIK